MSNKPQPNDTADTQNENNNPGLLTHLGERIGDIEDKIKAATDTEEMKNPSSLATTTSPAIAPWSRKKTTSAASTSPQPKKAPWLLTDGKGGTLSIP